MRKSSMLSFGKMLQGAVSSVVWMDMLTSKDSLRDGKFLAS